MSVFRRKLDRLGDEVAAWVASGDPAGAEILIVKDSRAVFHEAYGWSDREEERTVKRGSIFRIRSMKKSVVGTAVPMLVEEGAIRLGDAGSAYLPSSIGIPSARSPSVSCSPASSSPSGYRAPQALTLRCHSELAAA